jgi:hypothetical protein
MRRFADGRGGLWDVVVGRESWGTLYALFVPAGRDEAVRQALLHAAGYDEAQRELDALDEAALRELLSRATPKES